MARCEWLASRLSRNCQDFYALWADRVKQTQNSWFAPSGKFLSFDSRGNSQVSNQPRSLSQREKGFSRPVGFAGERISSQICAWVRPLGLRSSPGSPPPPFRAHFTRAREARPLVAERTREVRSVKTPPRTRSDARVSLSRTISPPTVPPQSRPSLTDVPPSRSSPVFIQMAAMTLTSAAALKAPAGALRGPRRAMRRARFTAPRCDRVSDPRPLAPAVIRRARREISSPATIISNSCALRRGNRG